MVRGGYAWVGSIDPRDPTPPTMPRSGQLFDTLARIDLSTGLQTTWIYRPGQAVDLIGLDSIGRPLVSVASGPDFDTSHRTTQMLTAPDDAGVAISSLPLWLAGAQSDGDRIWFGNDRGIYVWRAADGLRKVYGFSGANEAITPAGRCV